MGLLCLVSNVELYSQYCLKMSYDKNGNRISTMLNECMETFRDSADNVVTKNAYEEVLVYPNPSKGEFKVELKNATDNSTELYVYDNKGVVISKQVFIEKTNIDISNNPAGAYLLRIHSDDSERCVIVIKV